MAMQSSSTHQCFQTHSLFFFAKKRKKKKALASAVSGTWLERRILDDIVELPLADISTKGILR